MDCTCHAPLSMGILQARTLKCVAMYFSRGLSWPRDQTQISCITGGFFSIWAITETCLFTFRPVFWCVLCCTHTYLIEQSGHCMCYFPWESFEWASFLVHEPNPIGCLIWQELPHSMAAPGVMQWTASRPGDHAVCYCWLPSCWPHCSMTAGKWCLCFSLLDRSHRKIKIGRPISRSYKERYYGFFS